MEIKHILNRLSWRTGEMQNRRSIIFFHFIETKKAIETRFNGQCQDLWQNRAMYDRFHLPIIIGPQIIQSSKLLRSQYRRVPFVAGKAWSWPDRCQ